MHLPDDVHAIGSSSVSEAGALDAIGECLIFTDSPEDAEAAFSASIELRRAIGDGSLPDSLTKLAILKISQDKFSEALSLLHESLSLLGQCGAVNRVPVEANIALATIGQGDLIEGGRLFRQVLSELQLLGDGVGLKTLQTTAIAAVALADRLGQPDASAVLAPVIDDVRQARARLM